MLGDVPGIFLMTSSICIGNNGHKMAEILDDGSDEDVMRDEEYEM